MENHWPEAVRTMTRQVKVVTKLIKPYNSQHNTYLVSSCGGSFGDFESSLKVMVASP